MLSKQEQMINRKFTVEEFEKARYALEHDHLARLLTDSPFGKQYFEWVNKELKKGQKTSKPFGHVSGINM